MTNRFEAAVARAREAAGQTAPQGEQPAPRNRFEAAVERGRALRASMPQAQATQGSILDPIAQGLTFGAADEIGGAVSGAYNAVFGDGDFSGAYARTRDQMRGELAAYKERRPYTAMGAEFVGAIPTALIPGGAAARGATLGGRVARGAATGAAAGAVYGFNSGEGGMLPRTINAAGDAALGAGVGAALPAAAGAVGAGYRAIRDAIRPNALTREGVGRRAQTALLETLENDGMTPADVAQRARDYGPDAMPADTSEALRNKADVLVHFDRPGAREKLREPLRQRQEMRRETAAGLFDDVLGPQRNVPAYQRQLREQRRVNANWMYRGAEEANAGWPVDTRPVLEAMRQDVDADTLDALIAGRDVPTDLPEEQVAREMARRLVRRRSADDVADPWEVPTQPAREVVEETADTADDGLRPDDPAWLRRTARTMKPSGRRPVSLSRWMRAQGFQENPSEPMMGDLRQIVSGSGRGGSGFIRSSGKFRSLDHAREVAEEAGYIPPGSDINDFLQALDDDLKSGGRYANEDAVDAIAWREYDAIIDDLRRADTGTPPDAVKVTQRAADEPADPVPEVDGPGTLTDVSEFQRLSRVQQVVLQRARALMSSADGNQRLAGQQLMRYHDALVKSLDDASDGLYGQARGRYRDDSVIQEAFERGQGAFKPSEHPHELTEFRSLLPSEGVEALKAGARDNARAVMSSSRGDLTAVQQLAAPGTRIRENLAAIIGPDEAERIGRRARGEIEKRKTEAIGGNSATARRLQDPDNGQGGAIPVDAGIVGAPLRMGQKLAEALAPDIGRGRARGMAEFLGSQGERRDMLIAELQKEAVRRKGRMSKEKRDLLNALLSVRAPVAVGGSGTPGNMIESRRNIPTITVRPR